MCRYAMHPVRTHWACLPCRFSAKHPRETTQHCPHCSRPMADMGRDFHVPRTLAGEKWRVAAAVIARGYRYDSCGCSGPGWRPSTMREFREWEKTLPPLCYGSI